MSVILTGKDLTLEAIHRVALGESVEIHREADQRLEDSRQLVYDLVESDVPVYGFNTGVGWNKDRHVAQDFFAEYNRNLIYSHTLGVAPEASEAEVRAIMVVRLNALLGGYTGIQPAVARRYAQFLNAGIHPVVPERGSVGEGDIGTLSHIGLAMLGEGDVHLRGVRMSAAEALKQAGLEPVVLGPKDGLAVVSSNAQGAGQGALLLHDLWELADLADLLSSLALEALNGNTSPLDPRLFEIRNFPGQRASAALMRRCLEGSYIYDADPHKPVQDPLCFRGLATINGSLRDGLTYVSDFMTRHVNTSDDNPCCLIEERRMISCSNFEVTTIAAGFEMISVLLSHLSRNACFCTIKLSDPRFTRLSRFLSADEEKYHCFGASQKVFASLEAENRHLSNPSTADYFALAGDIEDHASNLPHVVQRLRKMADNLKYIFALEMMHISQALELRVKVNGDLRLGRGTAPAWDVFRREIPFIDRDRPLSFDIEKAYSVICSGALLDAARKALKN